MKPWGTFCDKVVQAAVFLEPDHTTDVRRWKLGVYEESGFPEVWVSVPWERSRGSPELAIHVLEGGRYRVSEESRAFAGWRAEVVRVVWTVRGPE